MRATFFCWSFGLISVSILAGCSLFDKNGSCDKCGTGGGRGRVASASSKRQQNVSSIAKAKSKPGAEEVAAGKLAPSDADLPPLPGQGQEVSSEGPPTKVEYLPETTQQAPPLSTFSTEPSRIMPATHIDTAKDEHSVVLKNATFKYGHGANFESVTGQVQAFRKTLRLRYASIEQEDPYGGAVVLEGDTSKLRDGQHVRVQGTFVPPTDRNGSAKYRVVSVEILD